MIADTYAYDTGLRPESDGSATEPYEPSVAYCCWAKAISSWRDRMTEPGPAAGRIGTPY
jgi:hypothetical protein